MIRTSSRTGAAISVAYGAMMAAFDPRGGPAACTPRTKPGAPPPSRQMASPVGVATNQPNEYEATLAADLTVNKTTPPAMC